MINCMNRVPYWPSQPKISTLVLSTAEGKLTATILGDIQFTISDQKPVLHKDGLFHCSLYLEDFICVKLSSVL